VITVKCQYCFNENTKVLESRDTEEDATRRRRECERCGKRFTTYERAEIVHLTIMKKDGTEEPFDKNKLRAGIEKACEKRPIPQEAIDGMVNNIEMKLRRRNSTKVKSSAIGDMVMTKLKKLDEVAYLRFASVYRSFDDVKEFKKELELLRR
jgi:transcriptional repressor NrdR